MLLCALLSSINPASALPSLGSASEKDGPITLDLAKSGSSAESQTAPPIVRLTLPPTDDAFVDNIFTHLTFGQLREASPEVCGPAMKGQWEECRHLDNFLIVRDTPDQPSHTVEYIYLKFDLASLLSGPIAKSGASPANATLSLYVRYVPPSYNASIEVHRVLSNEWKEDTLTWTNRPPFDPKPLAVQTIGANGTRFRWDILGQILPALREGLPVSFVLVASDTSWRNHVIFDSKDHPQTSISTAPELDLDFPEPVLTLEAPYANIPITLDGQTFGTATNGKFQAYLPWGDYNVSVPEVITEGEGARAVFHGWSDNLHETRRVITVEGNTTLRLNYEMQYKIDVFSPYALTNGSAWYTQNTQAVLSVRPTEVAKLDLLGQLGARYIFDHWAGDCTTSKPECTIIVDGPKAVTAVWREDYTVPTVVLVLLAAGVTVLLGLFVRRRKTTS